LSLLKLRRAFSVIIFETWFDRFSKNQHN